MENLFIGFVIIAFDIFIVYRYFNDFTVPSYNKEITTTTTTVVIGISVRRNSCITPVHTLGKVHYVPD